MSPQNQITKLELDLALAKAEYQLLKSENNALREHIMGLRELL